MLARAFAVLLCIAAPALPAQSPLDRFPQQGPLVLHAAAGGVLEGTMDRAENPARPDGRHIALHVVVVPAKAPTPRPDPVVILAGGPGQAATTLAPDLLADDGWVHEQYDVVLVDQRGTGGSNALHVPLPGSAADPQGYLDPIWREDVFRTALADLQLRADLTMYTTALAMDDVDAACQALGCGKVNLMGASYGTRAALIFMRRHEDHVRCAVLDGCAPIAFRNPLFHASAAQGAFAALRQEVLDVREYKDAYGDLDVHLQTVLKRLDAGPCAVDVEVAPGVVRSLQLSRDGFAEALRQMLYREPQNRRAPALLHAAAAGDLRPFANLALANNRALHEVLACGLLMCVTNAEDLPRIGEEEIVRETKGTFLGDARVRAQLRIGAFWPRAEVPDADVPVAVATPVLLLSGTQDPVTPPRFGAEAASHLPHSLHVVVHGCHGVGEMPGVSRLVRQFVDSGSVDGLDTTRLRGVRMAPIELAPPSERPVDLLEQTGFSDAMLALYGAKMPGAEIRLLRSDADATAFAKAAWGEDKKELHVDFASEAVLALCWGPRPVDRLHRGGSPDLRIERAVVLRDVLHVTARTTLPLGEFGEPAAEDTPRIGFWSCFLRTPKVTRVVVDVVGARPRERATDFQPNAGGEIEVRVAPDATPARADVQVVPEQQLAAPNGPEASIGLLRDEHGARLALDWGEHPPASYHLEVLTLRIERGVAQLVVRASVWHPLIYSGPLVLRPRLALDLPKVDRVVLRIERIGKAVDGDTRDFVAKPDAALDVTIDASATDRKRGRR